MKANEAPEKFYLLPNGLISYCGSTKDDAEYIRKDAFIEKAKEAFCKATCNGHPPRSTCTSLGTCKEHDNFVKYMKGE